MSDIRLRLLNAARGAKENAYAPYSGFKVGAAISDADGNIFIGCNVENASYGLTICAERGALCALIAAGGNRPPAAIAVVAEKGVPCPPCGACRQVLMEFNPDLEIILESGDKEFELFKLSEILPLSFSAKNIADTPS